MSVAIDKGAQAEYLFASECLGRGLVPNWPSTEGKPYDMILDTGPSAYKVQVKGSVREGTKFQVMFLSRTGSKKRRYTKSEVDFIALYLFKYAAWYIFPIDDVETGVTIKPTDPFCKQNIYKDAWHLITGKKDV